jgi:hypothetical protein
MNPTLRMSERSSGMPSRGSAAGRHGRGHGPFHAHPTLRVVRACHTIAEVVSRPILTAILMLLAAAALVDRPRQAAVAAEAPATGSKGGLSPPAYGEPYALAGRRLVFLNWFYVRPGGFSWLDSHGRSVGGGRQRGGLGGSLSPQ